MNQTNSSSNYTENIIQFLEKGFLKLQVNDFAAHIELESSIKPSQSLTSYKVPMPPIGLPGFQVRALLQHFHAIIVAYVFYRYLVLLLLAQCLTQVYRSGSNWLKHSILRMGLM